MSRIIGQYIPNWNYGTKLQNMNSIINTFYIFTGTADVNKRITFQPPNASFYQDINAVKQTGKRIILTVGGAGLGFSLDNREQSQNFVNSIINIYNTQFKFDGLDWNNFETVNPSTGEMIWVSLQLKAHFGNFIITCPPASWNGADKTMCLAMKQAGALDFAMCQYYDGPGLNDMSQVLPQVRSWVALLGENYVGIGLGMRSAANYWNVQTATDFMNAVLREFPNIRGAFNWEGNYDIVNGSPFAQVMNNLPQFKNSSPIINNPVPVVNTPMNNLQGYTFYQGQDIWEGTITQVQTRDINELANICNNTMGAVAFNTNGFIKNIRSPLGSWKGPNLDWPDAGINEGTYIKNNSPIVNNPVVITPPVINTNSNTISGEITINGQKYTFSTIIK